MFDFINIRGKHFVKRKTFPCCFLGFLINIPPGGRAGERDWSRRRDSSWRGQGEGRRKIDKSMQAFIALHHRLRSLELNYRDTAFREKTMKPFAGVVCLPNPENAFKHSSYSSVLIRKYFLLMKIKFPRSGNIFRLWGLRRGERFSGCGQGITRKNMGKYEGKLYDRKFEKCQHKLQ